MFGFTIPGIALKLLPYAAGAIIVAIIFKFGVNFGRGIERVHTEEAKKEFASYKQEEQEARLRSTVVQLSIRDEVRSLYDQSIKDSTALAGAVRDLSRGISVCASTSAMRVSQPPAGTGTTSPSPEYRPAIDVLQDLAAKFAERADRTAIEHNALIDWLERTRSTK